MLPGMEDDELRALQMEELNILRAFRRVCEEQGLRYCLTGGTLLGAVRHKGFIPWDDDGDVEMFREDYERFISLGVNALGPGYVCQSTATDPEAPRYFAKLRSETLVGKRTAFVDVFPLDKCPDRKALAILQMKGVRLMSAALMARELDGFECGYSRWYMRALFQVMCRVPSGVLVKLRDGIRRFFGLFASGRKVCNADGRYSYPGEVREMSWYGEEAALEFEGERFSAPCGWDALLTNMFGNYMTPPPESERQGHYKDMEER